MATALQPLGGEHRATDQRHIGAIPPVAIFDGMHHFDRQRPQRKDQCAQLIVRDTELISLQRCQLGFITGRTPPQRVIARSFILKQYDQADVMQQTRHGRAVLLRAIAAFRSHNRTRKFGHHLRMSPQAVEIHSWRRQARENLTGQHQRQQRIRTDHGERCRQIVYRARQTEETGVGDFQYTCDQRGIPRCNSGGVAERAVTRMQLIANIEVQRRRRCHFTQVAYQALHLHTLSHPVCDGSGACEHCLQALDVAPRRHALVRHRNHCWQRGSHLTIEHGQAHGARTALCCCIEQSRPDRQGLVKTRKKYLGRPAPKFLNRHLDRRYSTHVPTRLIAAERLTQAS